MRALAFALALGLAACSGAASEPASSVPTSGDEGTDNTGAATPGEQAPPEMSALLAAHNAHRVEHCAPPLSWSNEIAQQAQAWADSLQARGCALQHSSGDLGENLAAGTSGTLSGASVTDLWYRESAAYDFRRGGFSMRTGHFTQLVWMSTQRIGCGVAHCDGMDLWVCNYGPPGNVEGQYAENVRQVSCRGRK